MQGIIRKTRFPLVVDIGLRKCQVRRTEENHATGLHLPSQMFSLMIVTQQQLFMPILHFNLDVLVDMVH